MALRFTCDSCGKTLKADESKAGKRVKCPGCDYVVTIPEPEAEVEEFDDFGSYDENDRHDENNPFAAPKSHRPAGSSIKRGLGRKYELAGRGKRLRGALLDGLIVLVFLLPAAIWLVAALALTKGQGDQPSPFVVIPCVALILGGLGFFIGLNFYLLATRSQSIGKDLLKMQVINFDTDEPADFVKVFVLRGFVNGLIGAIPIVGPVYPLVDALFIFGEDRRCLHDKLAGTYVADVS